MSPRDAADRITSRWQNRQADAYLITGTGLPTLRVVAELSQTLPGPVLSSNLCLAWATLLVAGIHLGKLAPTPHMPLLAGWAPRINQL